MSVTQDPKTTEADKRRLIKAIEGNWQAEMEGAATYQALADREADAKRRHTLEGLALAEQTHARLWERRLTELGASVPHYSGPATGVADTLPNRIGGTDATLRRIEIEERKHVASYGRQLQELGDEPSVAILEKVIADERAHSKALKHMLAPVPSVAPPVDAPIGQHFSRPLDPQQALDDLRARKGHKSPASWIGDAIYGVNDGLGAIFGIVSGVSGATAGGQQDRPAGRNRGHDRVRPLDGGRGRTWPPKASARYTRPRCTASGRSWRRTPERGWKRWR